MVHNLLGSLPPRRVDLNREMRMLNLAQQGLVLNRAMREWSNLARQELLVDIAKALR